MQHICNELLRFSEDERVCQHHKINGAHIGISRITSGYWLASICGYCLCPLGTLLQVSLGTKEGRNAYFMSLVALVNQTMSAEGLGSGKGLGARQASIRPLPSVAPNCGQVNLVEEACTVAMWRRKEERRTNTTLHCSHRKPGLSRPKEAHIRPHHLAY
ncbi:hypothetical protein E2C01_000302 [Portunus trituberculatus]|uniref:Uncharacterized protein n=1 Tax=Portunus trituberculatus TaxID=210409 RepID=A0A5B7CEB4_PORTR|nr:hypothetical protein [Portunus trituberculatus]